MEAIKLRPPHTSSSSQLPSISGFSFWSSACNSKAKVLSRPPQWRLRSVQPPWKLKRLIAKECTTEKQQQAVIANDEGEVNWGKVSAVLFDMDGVLCNSEEPSRMAAVSLFEEMGVSVTVDDFVPFMGMGEAYFLGGVAQAKGVKNFNADEAKKRFFEIYLDKYAKPNSGLGFPGALELINECKNKGLKVSVASSADRIKVEANLAASGLPSSMFDCIVSADAFENLKPAPDIFLAASKLLDVPPSECLVIEDALAGLQAANAALMRCIAVTTTLSEESLSNAEPSLIRKNIGSISIEDILFGGFSSSKKKLQDSKEKLLEGFDVDKQQIKDKELSPEQFQGSRRNVLKYGSLGIALSCLYFAFSNRKAMQYASPKAIWNLFFGVPQPSIEKNTDLSESSRVKQLVKYIAELENGKMSTKVPEFPSKLDWLNTAPLRFNRDLKGKVVLLDFWTYCCINCMHVLPDLEFLEKKYKNMPFTVVGVHSAKFDNEKDLNAIRNAVIRYKISHPVVNDGDMYMWRELGVNSWPTFALVAPNGNVIAQLAGEGRRQVLDDLIEAALVYYGGKNLLESTPIQLNLEANKDPRLLASPLNFPGKLAVDRLNQRLFISDSNHNRIVVTDFNGNFLTQIGSTGEEGLRDGTFEEATFNRPQGVAYNAKKNVLYVADTENHALREIDLVNETVRTLSGNGTKGSDYEGGKTGTSQLLNSPWDVCFDSVNDMLYIAMAGQHQIWVHNTLNGVTAAFSGDGYERNLNGPSGKTSSFAQPSGISLSPDMKDLYVADSESSSIRVVNLSTGGSQLLVGGDPFLSDNLFKFGDRDGVGSEVLLQHPLGVVHASDNNLYIADSYNHKIKKIDTQTKRVTTIAGTGTAGFLDGTPLASQLSEPAGIVEAQNGTFIIADTNNSLLRILDLKSPSPKLRTLQLEGVRPPLPNSRAVTRLRRRPPADALTVRIAPVSAIEGELSIAISLPEDYHFSKEARSRFYVDVEPVSGVVLEPADGFLTQGTANLHFARSPSVESSVGRISCKVYYCKEDELCLYQSLAFEVPFQPTGGDTSSEVVLSYEVKPPNTSINEIGLPVGK